MAEVNASSPEQKGEAGAVFGRMLFHTLEGRCIISRSLPDQAFFLDYLMDYLGPENFTATGKRPQTRASPSPRSSRVRQTLVVFGFVQI